MSLLVKIIFAVVLAVTAAQPAAAQNVSAQKQSNTELATTQDKLPSAHRRALSLLDQVLQSSTSFEDVALKLKIQAVAADMLWRFDEPRARKMYEVSFHDIDTIKPASDERNEVQFLPGFKARLRAEILKSLSLHDKDFAQRLAKTAAEERPPDGQPVPRCVGCGVQNTSASMRLAFDLAQTDPKRSFQLAKEELSGGINPMLNSVLHMLRLKEPALADQLFSHALTIARQQSVYLSDSVNQLSRYVFPNFGAGAIKPPVPQRVPKETKPEVIEQFLNFVADAVEKEAVTLQARGRDSSDSQFGRRVTFDYFLGELMLPYFDRHLPGRAAAVRARIEDIIAVIPPDEANRFLDEFRRERTPSILAEQADAEKDTERQQSRYVDAVFQADARGQYDEALAIARKIGDDSIRGYVESRVRYEMALAALSQDTEAAYRLAGDVSDPGKQGSLLGQIASNRFHQKDVRSAVDALTEAEQIIAGAEAGLDKAVEMVNLVYAAATIDLARGFEAMKSAVDALNAAELPRKFATRIPLASKSTGKVFMWMPTGLELLRFDGALGRIAREDFDRSLHLVEAIQSREVLALAQLVLCQIALSQHYPPPPETPKAQAKPKQN